MKNNPVVWFEIYVKNMKRAKKFYESVFGLTLKKIDAPQIEMWVFPEKHNAYGAHGALVRMSGFPAGRNSVLVYFSCADCAVQEKKVLKFGGKVQKTKMSIGKNGFISLVFDTEGNMFGLHSMK